jgi:hypothetical protein
MTEPLSGIVEMTDTEYRSHNEALSSSGAKTILECPALFKHAVLDGHRKDSAAFSFGRAAHAHILGTGDVTVIDHADYRTAAAKADRDEALMFNSTPILAKDWATVEAMADAIRNHDTAAALLDPTNGKAEQSLFWHADGIEKRARIDWLPTPDTNGRIVVTDYKTTTNPDPHEFAKAVANYGYHQQDDWYSEAVSHCCLNNERGNVKFVFVTQSKEAPYLVSVVELDAQAKEIGHQRNQRAIRIYKECVASGVWPGYVGIEPISLPVWAIYQHEEQQQMENRT